MRKLDERMDALVARTRDKIRLSGAELAEAAALHKDAERAGRQDLKRKLRSMVDRDKDARHGRAA